MRSSARLTLAIMAIAAAQAEAAPAGRLLYRGSSEFGWSHSGVRSWGGNWGVRAQNEALEQIKTRIASMVNLRQLDEFTHSNLTRKIDASGQYSEAIVSGKISLAESKDATSQSRWVNGNNFLIDVRNVRIKPGTDYSKTHDGGPFGGGRSWEASATMIYDYEVYGPPGIAGAAQGGGSHANS